MPRPKLSDNPQDGLGQHLEQSAPDGIKPHDSPQPIEELLHELQDMLGPRRFLPIQAWHLARGEQLTPVQQQLLEKMDTILVVDWAPYANQPLSEPGMPEYDYDIQTGARYTSAVLKALRHRLEDHPILDDWWRTRATLGDRRTLRRAKRGFEKYAVEPYSAEEAVEAQAYFDTGQVPPTLNELSSICSYLTGIIHGVPYRQGLSLYALVRVRAHSHRRV
jgi:hypothetical protein